MRGCRCMDPQSALDDVLQRLAVDLAAIDRETRRYYRKLAGLEEWTEFHAPSEKRMVEPKSVVFPVVHSETDVGEHGEPFENPAPCDDGSPHPRGPE